MNEPNPELSGLDTPIEAEDEPADPTVPLGAAGVVFGVCLVAAAVFAATGLGTAGTWTYVGAFLVACAVALAGALRGAAYNEAV